MENRVKGFTLIEVIIVVVIISIIATVAVMSLSHAGSGERVNLAIEQFTHVIPAAEQQAILQPAILGMQMSDRGYQFYQLITNATDNTVAWHSLSNDHLSAPNAFTMDIKFTITSNIPDLGAMDTKSDIKPQIIFFPNGDVTPATLLVGNQDTPDLFQLDLSAQGTLTTTQYQKSK